MNKQDLLTTIHQQFQALSTDKTLIILHPADYQFHRHTIYQFLLSGQGAYFHYPASTGTLDAFYEELVSTLEQQTSIALPKLPTHPVTAAQKVAELLNKQPDFTLLIDAYDRIEQPDVDKFVLTLAENLTANHRIVIRSRTLPSGLLHTNGRLAMIPYAPDKLLVDYTTVRPEENILEVRSLGPGRALIDGRSLERWDGLLPKCLFFFMVDRAMTTRNDIFDTFWPNLKKHEATNVFHVTKRKISEILGQDLTTYGSGFYRIADNIQVYYDVVAFQEAVQNAAIADEDSAILMYQDAIRLYRGPFLSTIDQDWVIKRREELQSVYVEALCGLADIHHNRSQLIEALGFYQRASAITPQREDIVRDIMNIYLQLGQPQHARDAYERLRLELKEVLHVDPSPETQKLARQIP